MRAYWWLLLLIVAAHIVAEIVFALVLKGLHRATSARDDGTPRSIESWKRMHRVGFTIILVGGAFGVWYVAGTDGFTEQERTGLLVGVLICWAAFLGGAAYLGFSRYVPRWLVRQIWDGDRGRCPMCEYDLTANASGSCPECGWKIPSDRDKSA